MNLDLLLFSFILALMSFGLVLRAGMSRTIRAGVVLLSCASGFFVTSVAAAWYAFP